MYCVLSVLCSESLLDELVPLVVIMLCHVVVMLCHVVFMLCHVAVMLSLLSRSSITRQFLNEKLTLE